MKCSYCGKNCDERPFRLYAECWDCFVKRITPWYKPMFQKIDELLNNNIVLWASVLLYGALWYFIANLIGDIYGILS